MKKGMFFLTAMFFLTTLQAQTDKYVKAMEPKVQALDTARSVDELLALANSFERIGDAEKTEWLPYYYAALSHVNAGMAIAMDAGMAGGFSEKTDPEADKAENLLATAQKLTKENSEIWIVKKMIATLRMVADPMTRYMQYGPLASEALETAKKLNPENPRVYLLEGQDKYFTPEQFGGSKTEAKKLFETAMAKYNAFKPESIIHPSWGMPQLKHFLSEAN